MGNIKQDFAKGSEWRRWDLHVHTKGTSKNDQFESQDFNLFCQTLFTRALEKGIAVIGVTDYFSIDNYKKVKAYVDSLSIDSDDNVYTDDEVTSIKNILLLPNVELRILPVTNATSLVNIHCIFNPEILDKLDDDFFAKMSTDAGAPSPFSMTRSGIIRLGRHMDPSLADDLSAYSKGIDNFAVTHTQINNVVKQNDELNENCFVAVSNSSNDGASAFNKHYDLFEHENTTGLDGTRRAIYVMSDFIFSGNPKDRMYFSGNKGDSIEQVREKVGSLKPCIHGSDAHSEAKLFEPDLQRYCWIKADPTFEGLRQIKFEPTERVFIGEVPDSIKRVQADSTRYINQLNITIKSNMTPNLGDWFGNTSLPLNNELVAIIGNKGGGKSAIADVIGFVGNSKKGIIKQDYSFLTPKRFKKKGLADCFDAQLIWEDTTDSKACLINEPDPTSPERVQYIPQNFFEALTNELTLTKFESELKRVVFSHLPDAFKSGKENFEDLEQEKTQAIESEIYSLKAEIEELSREIVKLEKLRTPSELEGTNKELQTKKAELAAHERNKPIEPKNDPEGGAADNKNSERIKEINEAVIEIDKSIKDSESTLVLLTERRAHLTQALSDLLNIAAQVESFKSKYSELLIEQIDTIKLIYDKNLIEIKVDEVTKEIGDIKLKLNTSEDIGNAVAFDIDGADKKSRLENTSLFVKRSKLVSERTELKEKISEPARERQNYIEALQIWGAQKNKIEGNNDDPNANTSSIAYFENKKYYIETHLNIRLTEIRKEIINRSKSILQKKTGVLDLYNQFKGTLENKMKDLLNNDDDGLVISFETAFKLDREINENIIRYVDGRKKGTFYNGDTEGLLLSNVFNDRNFQEPETLSLTLSKLLSYFDKDYRESSNQEDRYMVDQVPDLEDLLKIIHNLDYLKPVYRLKLDGKDLQELSPGEKGALLLVFYLTLDKESVPLIIDQPEDNLDNKTVYKLLTRYIREAKRHRQIIIVTHNPNLAIGADAEQIIYVDLNKLGNHSFSYITGSVENPIVNAKVVEVLEGTMPAFDKRRLKYLN